MGGREGVKGFFLSHGRPVPGDPGEEWPRLVLEFREEEGIQNEKNATMLDVILIDLQPLD